MSILKVSRMGHPVLRKRTVLVQPDEINTSSMQRLIDDMFDTMHEYVGIGLAAPQVHQERRLFVAGVDDPNSTMQPVVMINPEIEVIDDEKEEDWEGCLSIPDIRGKVIRAKNIRVRFLDRHGRLQQLTATGFPARVIQHETDHLNGVLFVDRMTSFESLTFLEEYGRYWDSGSGPDE
jgi:peptide deformylase